MAVADPHALLRAIAAAEADPYVETITIDFDSPGGGIKGVAEAARALATCNKPTTATVSGTCASAAYWIAAGASELLAASETSTIGGIGCFIAVADYSRAYSAMGVDVRLVSSGGVKGQGTQGVPLSEAFIKSLQTRVDAICEMFCKDVSEFRGQDLRQCATGEAWFAQDALQKGLIDGVTMTRSKEPAMAGAQAQADTSASEQHDNRSELAALQEKYDRLLARQQDREKTFVIDAALTAGRVLPAQREALERLSKKIPLEALEEFLAASPVQINKDPVGEAAEQPKASDPAEAFMLKAAAIRSSGTAYAKAYEELVASDPEGFAAYRARIRKEF